MRKTKRFFWLVSVLLLVSWNLGASGGSNPTPEDLFIQANQHFEKGELDKAGEIYHALIKQGYEGANLYYNIGNLSYRRGERGKAILWYERAAHLSPRDSDIQFNLDIARSHIKEKDENLIRKIVLYLTTNELSWITLILTWAFFLVLGGKTMGWFKSEVWPPVHLALSGTILVFFVGWLVSNIYFSRLPLGIVTVPPGEVRNGPGHEYAVGFTIPEGSKVIILNKRPDWIQVGVAEQGLKGWMPKSEVESIILTALSLS